ncbi:hypothetical protein ES708_30552 [subsurface metagenome]
MNEIQDNLDSIYTALGITRTGCASGAGWTEFPIAGGLVTDKLSAQAQELRSVTDYAYENKCPAHDVSVQTGYENADKVGVDGNHYPGYDSSDYPGYYYNEHGTYQSGHLWGVEGAHFPGYFSDQHTGYESGYLLGVVW